MEPGLPITDTARTRRRAEFLAGIALFVALGLGLLALSPGKSGGFLFDDYPNLGGIEALKSDPGPEPLLQFLVGGIASPLGRPVSLASFALQMHDWPDNPAGFIHVNILLHLLNGTLLFWWLLRLTRLMHLPARAALVVPLASAALWIVAPLQVTSVLYVVQRMTELAASFTFLGMLLYLVGRERLARDERRAGFTWMSLGVLIGAGLGSLAKENAALMPLLIAVLEFTLLARLPRPETWRHWALVFLALPVSVVAGYLLWVVADPAPVYAGRDFTLAQRLMSEPRILFLYLYKLLLPWPSAMRLWYDDFALSTGLLQPWTTGLAILALLGPLGMALKWRARYPLAAFPVLWFGAAHLLESSVLPLELVFEHRNYQASVAIWFAIAAGGHALFVRASGAHVRVLASALGVAYFLLLVGVTWQIASLWGQPFAMTVWMAERLPESRRAQSELIGALIRRGYAEPAAQLAQAAAARWPDDPSFPLMVMQLSCQVPEVSHPDSRNLIDRLATVRQNVNAVVDSLDDTLSQIELGHCPIAIPIPFSELTEAAVMNKALRGQGQNRLLLHARALLVEGRYPEAQKFFGLAVDAAPKVILLLHGAINSMDAGDLDTARAYLHRAEADPRIKGRDRWSHRADIAALRAALDERSTPPSR